MGDGTDTYPLLIGSGAGSVTTFKALEDTPATYLDQGGKSVIVDPLEGFLTYEFRQEVLVSGTNIKTINGDSVLGSGDLAITVGSGGFAAPLYFSDSTSTIEPLYKTLSYTPDELATSSTIVCNSGETAGQVYLFELPIDTTVIDAGRWTANFFASVDSTNGETFLRYEAFMKEDGTGTETTLFSSTSQALGTSPKRVEFETTQTVFNVIPTARYGVRVFASTTSNNDRTVTYVVGDGNASYTNTPLATRHNQLRARDDLDSHPIEAITSLRSELDSKAETADIGTTIQPFDANTVIDPVYVHTDNNFTTALKNLLELKKVKDVTTDAINNWLVITYTDDTFANLNLDSVVTDIYVDGATLDANTNVLTLTAANGGADVTVDLSDFVNSTELVNALNGYYTKSAVDTLLNAKANLSGANFTGGISSPSSGIGTTTPNTKQEVIGVGSFMDGTIGELKEKIRLGRSDSPTIRYQSIKTISGSASGDNKVYFDLHDGTTAVSQSTVLVLRGDRKALIGTATELPNVTADHKLQVDGYLLHKTGWRDNIAPFTFAGTGAAAPTEVTDGAGARVLSFGEGDEITVVFHVDHDYAMGTDGYIHVHWSPTTAMTAGQTVIWQFSYTVAKGHQQGQSLTGTPTTISFTHTADGTEVAGEHMVTECSNAQAFDLLEPDTIIKGVVTRLDGTYNSAVHGYQADLHYLSSREVTIGKKPDFNVAD